MTDEIEKFDYVIIGAGSAGCIIANRLSACGKYSVCVVEAGPKDWHPMLYIPAGFIKTLVNPRFNWMYSSEPRQSARWIKFNQRYGLQQRAKNGL